MKGSSKFEVRSSKQIRRAKMTRRSVDMRTPWLVASSPVPSPPMEEREKTRRARSWCKLAANFGADVRLLTSAATRSMETLIFGFRVSNLIRVSGFEF
jgi:hypothetical protein